MARSLREISRFPVLSEKGKRIGRVHEVLFHPSRNEVVGYIVVRPRLLLIFDRRDRYLALSGTEVRQGSVVARDKSAWDKRAERAMDVSWEETVIWYGMTVRTESGKVMGTVRDGLFDDRTGALQAIGLTAGVTADAALGVRDIAASLVQGFNGDAIVVADEALGVEVDGGIAQAAGRTAAVAKVQAGEAAKSAQKAAKVAAAYGRSAVSVAAGSEAGKKTVGWLKSLRDEVVDAMGDPEDDE